MRGALSTAGLVGLMMGLIGLIGLSGVTGCATNTSALEEEMSRLRREVRTLHQKISDSELKVERLEGRVTLLALGQDGEVAPAPKTPVVGAARTAEPSRQKTIDPKIHRLAGPRRSLPVVKLSPSPEDGGSFDEGAIDDGSPPIMIRLGPDDGEDLPVDHKVLAKPDPVLDAEPVEDEAPRRSVTKAEIKAAYEIALAKLRIDGDAAASRKLLIRFARRYPDSGYADNVAYWTAECDFAERRYEDAARNFKKMIDAFPRSPKVPDAMVRQAEARTSLNQRERAEVLLAKVIAQHPDSEAAKKAKALLRGAEGQR